MATKQKVSPTVVVVVIVIVVLVLFGVGYKLLLAPKGGGVGASMSPQDVQNTMKQKGMMQPPGQSGASGVQQQMQQGGMMAPPGSSKGN